MAVVVFHFGRDVSFLEWGAPLWSVANGAVSFFFFLSGFILAYAYAPRAYSLKSFYGARVSRIVPLYYAALVATAAIIARSEGLSLHELGLNLLLVQSWVPGESQTLNSPGWSLSVEFAFYLAFPWILSGLRTRGSRTLAVVATAAWLLGAVGHAVAVHAIDGRDLEPWKDFVYYHPIGHFGTFVCGVAVGLLYLRHHALFATHSIALTLGGMALIVSTGYLIPELVQKYHRNGLFAPAFASIVTGVASIREPLRSALSVRPLMTLGEASYGIYILQGPVHLIFAFITERAGLALSTDVSFVVFTFTLCAVAVAGFFWVERPARAWLRSTFGV